MTILARRAGLLINPVAGQGFAKSATGIRKVVEQLGWDCFITGRAEAGQAALSGLAVKTEIIEIEGLRGRAYTLELARRIAQAGVDVFLVAGGDGTLADVAFTLVEAELPLPIFGLGTGSTNAGALVTCSIERAGRLRAENLRNESVPALLAYQRDKLIGVGFNDCVLGFTVVATVGGRLRDVSAVEKFLGQIAPGHPGSIGSGHTRVWRSGPQGEQTIRQGSAVAMVAVGLAERSFIAKAVTGGVCLASFSGVPAGCLVADYPLVQVELDREAVLALPPIQTAYTSFDSTIQIHVQGCKDGTVLSVDGNPLVILTEQDEVRFTVRESAVAAVKIDPGGTEGS